MDSTLFAFKRIFHTSISLGKRLLRDFGLTPSRFDMLHLLYRRFTSTRQSELRRELGVTAPTVSRMLASLERLGLVLRARPTESDRRQRDVSLTFEGRERISRAMRAMYEGDVLRFTMEKLIFKYWAGPDMRLLRESDQLHGKLHRIRRNFGDRSTLVHHPFGYELGSLTAYPVSSEDWKAPG